MITSRKNESSNGLRIRGKDLEDLYSLTRRATESLATLELEQPSLWTRKFRTKRGLEDLRISLLEVTDVIGSMESILSQPLNRKKE